MDRFIVTEKDTVSNTMAYEVVMFLTAQWTFLRFTFDSLQHF